MSARLASLLRRTGLHYSWIVAAVTFLVLLVGAGVRATPSILIVPLEHEFGWSAATIGAVIAVNVFLYGMIGPFAVGILERFGLRRTVTAALLILSASVGLTAAMRTPGQMMVLWGLLVGSGTGMIAMVFGATIVERWFTRHRGVVLGALTASSATGQLVFLPVLASLAVHHGWRAVSLAMAGVALLAIPFVLLLLRNRPADVGIFRYGEDVPHSLPPVHRNPAWRALSALRQGSSDRDFWLLAGSFFICGASTSGLIGTHLVPACADHAIPEVTAAGLLALMGFCDLIGTTFSGWLTDRFDSRKLLVWYYGLRGLSLLFLPYSFDFKFHGLSLFAVFYGLDWIATVPPTVKLAGQAFGEGNASLMFGWIVAAHQVGSALAAWLGGVIRTETGSYSGAFFSAGLLCFAATVMVAYIGAGREGSPSLSATSTKKPAPAAG